MTHCTQERFDFPCCKDRRIKALCDPHRKASCTHDVRSMVRQRIYGLAQSNPILKRVSILSSTGHDGGARKGGRCMDLWLTGSADGIRRCRRRWTKIVFWPAQHGYHPPEAAQNQRRGGAQHPAHPDAALQHPSPLRPVRTGQGGCGRVHTTTLRVGFSRGHRMPCNGSLPPAVQMPCGWPI